MAGIVMSIYLNDKEHGVYDEDRERFNSIARVAMKNAIDEVIKKRQE